MRGRSNAVNAKSKKVQFQNQQPGNDQSESSNNSASQDMFRIAKERSNNYVVANLIEENFKSEKRAQTSRKNKPSMDFGVQQMSNTMAFGQALGSKYFPTA